MGDSRVVVSVVRFIEMRRFIGNKAFKGTINVEFNTKEEAEDDWDEEAED